MGGIVGNPIGGGGGVYDSFVNFNYDTTVGTTIDNYTVPADKAADIWMSMETGGGFLYDVLVEVRAHVGTSAPYTEIFNFDTGGGAIKEWKPDFFAQDRPVITLSPGTEVRITVSSNSPSVGSASVRFGLK